MGLSLYDVLYPKKLVLRALEGADFGNAPYSEIETRELQKRQHTPLFITADLPVFVKLACIRSRKVYTINGKDTASNSGCLSADTF